jgi:hypothetical protein
MRAGVRGVAAALFAAGFSCCAEPEAAADPFPDHVPHYLLFAGTDLWRFGGFAHAGLVWAPGGLHESGLLLKAFGGAGTYRYLSGGTEVRGEQWLVSVLPGWKWKGQQFELSAFAGVDFQSHRFRPDDPDNRLRGDHTGVRIAIELWLEPLPATMLTAGASASTVGPSYWSRVAMGWRLFDSFWIGPEALAMGDEKYGLYQVGMHLTALRIGSFEWTIGLGWSEDSDGRTGAYGRLGVLMRM